LQERHASGKDIHTTYKNGLLMNVSKQTTIKLSTTLLIASASLPCAAQSSMQITGLLDSGVTYLSNQSGHSNVYTNNGVMRPNTLVMKGTEDLGGGNAAIFYLGTIFSMGTGSFLGSPGTMFTRESYVGLSNDIGTLSVGYQRDFMFDTLSMNGYSGAFYEGWFASHQGPFSGFGVPYNTQGSIDYDRLNGEAIGNTIKFSSKNFAGLTFGALYGFGETAGNTSTGNAVSFGANYDVKNAGIAAVYTKVKYPTFAGGTQGIQNAGLGVKYKFDELTLSGLYTLSSNTITNAKINTVDVNAAYKLSETWSMATTYTFMKGNSVLNGDKANALAGILTYHFSKTTLVYTSIAHQIASGPHAAARIASALGASNDGSQTAVTINLQKIF
jgi:predicted porin